MRATAVLTHSWLSMMPPSHLSHRTKLLVTNHLGRRRLVIPSRTGTLDAFLMNLSALSQVAKFGSLSRWSDSPCLLACSQYNSRLHKSLKYRVLNYSLKHYMTAVLLAMRNHNVVIIKKIRASIDYARDLANHV